MAQLAQHVHDAWLFLGRVLRHRQLVLFALGLVVGAVAAGAAIGFRDLIGLIQLAFIGFSSERIITFAETQPWWGILLAPALGGLAVGLFIHFLMPGRQPQGVAHVMEAAALRGGRMDIKAGLATALASAASIGCGASVGREGPVVHLGASLSSWLAGRLHLSRQLVLTLLGCGVASAIAASFNAPIAGVFFALEVVVGHYALSSFAPIVIASVTGTIISRLYYGNFPAFVIPERTIVSFWEFPAFAIVGIVAALIAVAFVKSALAAQDRITALPGPAWIKPAVAGLILGAVALQFPHILGVGYETTDMAIDEKFTLGALAVLLVLKFAATVMCLGAGFGGGVFSPSLVMGALAGGLVGSLATLALPEMSSGSSAYAIVGMGAVAGAVLGAPISTILIIFELTSSFSLTIAVMVGVVIASVITQATVGRSFFTAQLVRRGVRIDGGRETNLLKARKVTEIMADDFETVPEDHPLPRIRDKLRISPNGELFVTGEDGKLVGTITLRDLSEAAFDTSYDNLLNASDVLRGNPPALPRDANLEDARNLLDESHEDRLAVVEDTETMAMVGYVRAQDVIHAYNRALMQARAEERGEG
ncbi:MAG TPA: chloride channel protein [Alphaproteobacteria bacterium]|nr:chloride channel protein [Alphaproteobacteria bacterium]